MKKFLIQLVLFSILCVVAGELIIRSFKLVSDIPQRTIDPETGIQLYRPGQTGFYKQADEPWRVNEHGWVGVANLDRKVQFSVIGDSFIENLMNPISSNQGYLLQEHYQDVGFFEAGRSGVSFIEALEISKKLEKDIDPQYHLVYLNNKDFSESIISKGRYLDIVQIDLGKGEVHKSRFKSPLAKKVLYSFKLAYYFYGRFPILVAKQNLGEIEANKIDPKTEFDFESFNKLFQYSAENYSQDKLVFVFHPDIKSEFVTLSNEHGFKNLTLESGDDNWAISEVDSHWSSFGHNQAALQVKGYIDANLEPAPR